MSTSPSMTPTPVSLKSMQVMDPTPLQAIQARLTRLESFLQQDPTNQALRVDTFETALVCSEWARARSVLESALADGVDVLGWQMREGDFWLAQGRHEDARAVYEGLVIPEPAPPGLSEVLLHNRAYLDFAQGHPMQAVERLAPTLDVAAAPSDVRPGDLLIALQRLWLRALHHGDQLERALIWAQTHLSSGSADPSVLGVASLIALDAGDFDRARAWSTASTAVRTDGWPSPEGLVTVASIALYAGDAQVAIQVAAEAVRRAPYEGRAWSVLAFAQLLAKAMEPARAAFLHAVERMPAHIGTWHGLGWTQLLLGDRDGAMHSFSQALSLDRNFSESHGALAIVHALTGREEEARHEAELALRLDASNLSGRYAQALLSGEGRDMESLQRLTRRLLDGRMHALTGMGLADWIQSREQSGGSK